MSIKKTNRILASAAVIIGGLAVLAPEAQATEGYFQHGYGTAAKGMAGAGVAAPQDTQAAVNNPAGIRALGNRIDGSIAIFSPIREYDAKVAEVFISDKQQKSDKNIFVVPSMGASWDMGDYSLGLALTANGGMNTDYDTNVFTGGSNGRTGVDLMQAFVGFTYARDINASHSFGITPTIAIQRFSARGLQGFASISADPGNLTDNGNSYSYGGGLRVGWLTKVNDKLTLGFSGQTKMLMSKFHNYKGLFAEKGGFDIPAAVTVGASYKVNNKLTVNADLKRIFYNDVDSISNSLPGVAPFNTALGNLATSQSLGGADGVGFGWKDVSIVKLGAQYVHSNALTLRAGVAHNTDAFSGTETLFNILAPAVVDTHLSVGATYTPIPGMAWNFAFTHAFAASISGVNVNHATIVGLGGSGNGHIIDLEMYQNDLEVGLTIDF